MRLSDLFALLQRDYKARGVRAWRLSKVYAGNLLQGLSVAEVNEIDIQRIDAYRKRQRGFGRSRATVEAELSLLLRALRFAYMRGLVIIRLPAYAADAYAREACE